MLSQISTMVAISLNLEALTCELTHEQFYVLFKSNQNLVMECSPEGGLIIM